MNKTILRNSIIIMAARFLGPVISLVTLPIMLNGLGPEMYGLWILLQTLSLGGTLGFLDFNVQASLAKFAAEDLARGEVQRLNALFSSGLVFFAGMGGAAAVSLSLVADPLLSIVFKIPPPLMNTGLVVVRIFAIQTLLEFGTQPFVAMLQANQRHDLERYVSVASTIVSASVMIGALLLHHGIVTLAAISCLNALALAIGYAWLAHQILPSLGFRLAYISRSQMGRIFRLSSVLIGFRFIGIASRQANKYIVAPLLSVAAVGELNIVQRIYQIAGVFGSLISAAIMPAASAAHARGDWNELRDMYSRGTKYTVFVCALVTICGMVLAEPFLVVWLGYQYAYLALIAQLMLATLFFDALVSAGQNMTVGIGQPLSILPVNALAMAINIVVTIIMIPRVGLMGVVWGLASGGILGNLAQFVIINRLVKTSTWQVLRQSVLACVPGLVVGGVCAFAMLWIFPPRTLLEIGVIATISGLAGCGAFYLTGLDTREKDVAQAWLAVGLSKLHKDAHSVSGL